MKCITCRQKNFGYGDLTPRPVPTHAVKWAHRSGIMAQTPQANPTGNPHMNKGDDG
jgi:hypothetical protein